MRKFCAILLLLLLGFSAGIEAATLYSHRYCKDPRFHCIRIKGHQSWESLWPDDQERDLVKRVNRMNTPLYRGMIIAVPNDLSADPNSLSPFATQIRPLGNKTIIVSLGTLAWAAYDQEGILLKWGAISGGKGYCPDIARACHTVTGVFSIYDKRGEDCVSKKFPVGEGGAPMPFCMFFHGGFALHGSPAVPGYNASHGCVRLFVEDADWLNNDFTGDDFRTEKTQVIVLPDQPGVEYKDTGGEEDEDSIDPT